MSKELQPVIDDDYVSEVKAAKYMRVPHGFGEETRILAESVHDTVHRLYQEALNKKNGEADDEEIVHLMTQDVPKAIQDVGGKIEEARDYEEEIATDEYFGESSLTEYHLSQDERPEREQNFLENYREAEMHYRSIFEALDNPTGDENLVDFLENEYDLDLLELIPEVPEPRTDRR